MTTSFSRRGFVSSAAAAASLPYLLDVTRAFAADNGLKLAAAEPFSFDALIARAKDMAGKPYQAPYRPAPEVVQQIDYDVHGKIKYRADHALFADGPGLYPVTFFHLGQFFQKSVTMHVVENGQSQEIIYSPDYFDMPADSIARKLPADSGFAGFRLQEARMRGDWTTQDWLAFLGASYFRAIGALGQYGLSARGVALDVAASGPEEFPDFTNFWIDSSIAADGRVLIWALLDGPGITGAFQFTVQRGVGVVMEIDTHMFLRRDVERLGIAPLTSMFWFGEYGDQRILDWRPEVHDSDGLAMWTGGGERIWRPLNNVPRTGVSSFVDKNPKGFGLLQRDREFERYLDGVRYDLRPSLWVEPVGDWGEGAIQLVEIPTDDEIHDNVVAFWVPTERAKAGNAYHYTYRLHWLDDEPYPVKTMAHATATRMGRGGEPGRARPKGVFKFIVEFAGMPLEVLPWGTKPTAVITTSRGEISYVFTEPIPDTKRWRAQFDLTAQGQDPVELRMFLRLGDRPLSETWLYQFHPPVT